jgi:ribosome biogenesis GTPase
VTNLSALGWTRKLQAEAQRQLLRVDAWAHAEERARLRSFHRALRDRPNRPR